MKSSVCIAGGGPAGMMLGLLLARAGVPVEVHEKHADFLRDFRGDTIHPSTLEIMAELGLLDEFLKLPHQEARTLGGAFGGLQFNFADFSHLPTRCKFIAMMPQWDFLNFLAEHGKRYPGFQVPFAEQVKKEADILTQAVGIVLNGAQAEEILQSGRADLIAVGREALYDPHWALRAARELGAEEVRG